MILNERTVILLYYIVNIFTISQKLKAPYIGIETGLLLKPTESYFVFHFYQGIYFLK